MIFAETSLKGAYVIEPERVEDERGFFARTFCRHAFEERGLNPHVAQCSISFNRSKGTLRGLHYQAHPYGEAKLVRCTRGAAYDVIVDLRRDSKTFRRWFGVELNAESGRMVYVPEGLAHGFMTLRDDVELFYQISEAYRPDAARGVRWNDPTFGVAWPDEPCCMSARDRSYPDFT